MESLGTGRKEAGRGRKRQDGDRKRQEEAGRGRKRLSPFLPPSPAIPSLVPPKKGKKSLAYPPPARLFLPFYFFTFKCMNFLPLSVHTR